MSAGNFGGDGLRPALGHGGGPLCSIERGKGDLQEAERILGNSFTLLLIFAVALTVLGELFLRPLLYAFGASTDTIGYAVDYGRIYLAGNIFVLISLGMNNFINAQGFARIGMMTTVLGAVANILLDPLFIFVFGWGVRGAALATVISQALSALWVLKFLTGKRAILHLKLSCMKLHWERVKRILALGFSGFVMALTNSVVQVACNSVLSSFGGDLYVGVMTVINSIREIVTMPIQGLSGGAEPVLGFNYGAGKPRRVRQGIAFISVACAGFSLLVWVLVRAVPEPLIGLFNNDPELGRIGSAALQLYFCAFFMQALQFAGQSTFVALGKSKQATFFSIFRKVIIVVPLTLGLPHVAGLGADGVFPGGGHFQRGGRPCVLRHHAFYRVYSPGQGRSGKHARCLNIIKKEGETMHHLFLINPTAGPRTDLLRSLRRPGASARS